MRRALAVVRAVAVALAAAVLAAPVQATPADRARARRAVVLVRAAELTDRLERSQAELVTAQLRQTKAADRLAGTHRRVQARAVAAYVHGSGAAVAALSAPRPYLELAAAKQRQLLDSHRAASAEARSERYRAEAVRDAASSAAAELARVQAELDAVVAADDAVHAAERQRADEARRAALARRAGLLAAGGPGNPGVRSGGYAPSPLDPDALLPRHKRATERQQAVLARHSFGPLAPGAPLPAGLTATGQQVSGNASWYGPGFNGRPTASGAIYDQEAWTVASRNLALGSFLVVARGERRVLLLVNDRGPYVDDRVLDLSAAAARALGIGGVAPVVAHVVTG